MSSTHPLDADVIVEVVENGAKGENGEAKLDERDGKEKSDEKPHQNTSIEDDPDDNTQDKDDKGKKSDKKPVRSSIEEDPDDDLAESDQMVAMFERLSTGNRRRTIGRLSEMYSNILTSTLIDAEDNSSGAGGTPLTTDVGLESGKTASKPAIQKPTAPMQRTSVLDKSAIGSASTSNASFSDTPSLVTSKGQLTLSAGESRVIIQTQGYSYIKFGKFSGEAPVPSGQVDFDSWESAVSRALAKKPMDDVITAMQQSLVKPARSLVDRLLNAGDGHGVVKRLRSAYGTVFDKHQLMKEFYNFTQALKETPSAFLNRLFLHLEKCQRAGIILQDEAASVLLKQFNSGCTDQCIIDRLRLEEKENNPPDFGSLLMDIRREEAKQTKKLLLAKLAKSQCINPSTDTTPRYDGQVMDEVRLLRQDLAKLQQLTSASVDKHSQLACAQSQPHHKLSAQNAPSAGAGVGVIDEVRQMRQELSHLHQQMTTLQQQPQKQPEGSRQQQPPETRKKKRFCFKCGEYAHMVWDCKNPSNPDLVARRFDEHYPKKQEN